MAGFNGDIFQGDTIVLYGGHGFVPNDAVAPVISLVSSPTTKNAAYVVNVYDADPGLRTIELWAKIGSDPRGIMLHDGTNFWYPFNVSSTRTGAGTSGSPYVYTVYHAGGWPEGIEINVYLRAVDQVGNLQEVV